MSQPASPVPCPRSQTKARCGNLYPQSKVDGARWVCTRCRHIWAEQDIRALVAAQLHKSEASRPDDARQLTLDEAS